MRSSRHFHASLGFSCLAHVTVLFMIAGISWMGDDDHKTVSGEIIHIQFIAVQNQEPERDASELPPQEHQDDPLQEPSDPSKQEADTDRGMLRPREEQQAIDVVSPEAQEESSYWDLVRRRIAREIRYPPASRKRGTQDKVTVRMVIDSSGELLEARAVPSFGDGELTRAALMAVRRAAPFEPPCEHGISGARLTVELPIRFQIGQ